MLKSRFKFLFILFLIFLLSSFGEIRVNASGINELIESNINNNLDEEIIEKLNKTGLNDITVEGIRDIEIEKIFQVILQSIIDTIKQPLVILPTLISAILFLNIYEISCMDYIKQKGIISSIFKTTVFGAITVGISLKAMYKAVTALKVCNTFSVGLLPVYFSLLALGSRPTQSAAFHSTMLLFCNSFSSIITYIIIPAISMCCAMTYAIGLTESKLLNKLNKVLNKILKYGISLFMSVFATIITIKSNIGQSIDSVSSHLTKGIISSTVPIIGGYIAESLSSIKGTVSILKNGIGIYAVIAVILIILPSLIEMMLLSFVYKISDSFSSDSSLGSASFLKSLSENLDVLVVSQIAAIIMFLFSFVIVMNGI